MVFYPELHSDPLRLKLAKSREYVIDDLLREDVTYRAENFFVCIFGGF